MSLQLRVCIAAAVKPRKVDPNARLSHRGRVVPRPTPAARLFPRILPLPLLIRTPDNDTYLAFESRVRLDLRESGAVWPYSGKRTFLADSRDSSLDFLNIKPPRIKSE